MKTRLLSFVLVTCATSIAAVAVAAPVRWSANGHYYQAIPVGTPISWADANKAAKALGPRWHLATITSAEEDFFVRSLFPQRPVSGPTFWSRDPLFELWRGPWIGGFRVFGYKTFQWVNSEPVLYSAFFKPQWRTQGSPISYSYGAGWVAAVAWVVTEPVGILPVAYIAELSAPPANPGLELNQTTVAGCKNVTGRVNISMPAPAGGLVVNLSDTLYPASIPASLTIPAGATSKSFQITTRPVSGIQTGEIIATFGGQTYRQQLIVRPMGLKSLALSAPNVVGGTNVTGTATLECEAPWPFTVVLGSSNNDVADPVADSIVISQGLQSETFAVTTTSQEQDEAAWIFGTAKHITKSKQLHTIP